MINVAIGAFLYALDYLFGLIVCWIFSYVMFIKFGVDCEVYNSSFPCKFNKGFIKLNLLTREVIGSYVDY